MVGAAVAMNLFILAVGTFACLCFFRHQRARSVVRIKKTPTAIAPPMIGADAAFLRTVFPLAGASPADEVVPIVC